MGAGDTSGRLTGAVVVFDAPGEGERRVAETVQGSGLVPVPVNDLGALTARLRGGEVRLAIVALEALRRRVEATLRALRQDAPGAFILLVYSDTTNRFHLARRLWSSGLVDALLPRSAPPHELGPVLRQALVDTTSPTDDEVELAAPADHARTEGSVRVLREIAGGFAAQRSVEGLVRELHMKLPRLVDYEVAEVLVPDDAGTKLYVCPHRPLAHEQVWRLAGEMCRRMEPLMKPAPTVEQLLFVELPPAAGATEPSPDEGRRVTFPMVLGGEPVGCLGLLVAQPLHTLQVSLLRLFSAQLATALRYVQTLQATEAMSLKDELTGAHNRRFLTRVLEGEWRRTKRYHLQLSVAMLDIDHFKRLNDVHGHLVGDAVLRTFGTLIGGHLRTSDLLVRYGGEEFLVVFPETGGSEAMGVIDRLRVLVAHTPLAHDPNGGDVHITFSAGVAAEPLCASTSPEGLLQMADQALLKAKQLGRDRVVAATAGTEAPLRPDASGHERRRAIRVAARTPAVFVPLPSFEPRPAQLQAVNVSASGVAVRGRCDELAPHAYGLVYLHEDRRPQLARVAWMRQLPDKERDAGLQFITPDELVARQTSASSERPRALVVARQAQTRAVVERVLRAAAYEIDFFSAEQALTSVWLRNYSLLIVGDSSLRGDLGRLLQQMRGAGEAGFRIIAVNEDNDRRDALATIAEQQVEHLVAGEDPEEALFVTLSKLLIGEYFGITKYLRWGAETLTWTCGTPADKVAVLEGIRQLGAEVRCHPRILDLLVAAVDEMVINALYVPGARADEPRPPVTVQCGSDGRLLGVAVLDQHGVFRPEDMFGAIGTALQMESAGMPPGAERGHLGFRIMLGTLSQLAINVAPGRCTEVIGIVDLRKSLREFGLQAESLGVFMSRRLPPR